MTDYIPNDREILLDILARVKRIETFTTPSETQLKEIQNILEMQQQNQSFKGQNK